MVLKGLRAGLTVKETAELDKEIKLSEEQFRNCRSRLIEKRKDYRRRNQKAKRNHRCKKSCRKRRRI